MIDFLRYRHVCTIFSLSFILAGIVGYVVNGGFSYHIDFVGGSEVGVSFEKQLDIATLRSAFAETDWKDAVIQSIGTDNNKFIVKVGKEGATVEQEFEGIMRNKFSDNKSKIDYIAWVGAEVGTDIKTDSIIAVLLSLLSVLFYVGLRSQFNYGVGAIVSLAHDVLIVLSVFAIIGEQISLNVLAALLTILGYSLNDTIVIYSRIRENIALKTHNSLYDIINISTNQTLRRTILTSTATFLSVAAIYFLGGEALRGFALAMMIGIVAGTYSSIYIASAVMRALDKEAA